MLVMPKFMEGVEGGASLGVESLVGNSCRWDAVWAVAGASGIAFDVALDICFGSIFAGGLGIKGMRTGGASILRASRSGCSSGIVASKTATEH